jgi:hypothetical protein
MAVSSAIDTHLHAISTHLDVVVGKSWMPMPASAREPTPNALDDTWSKLTQFYISLKQGPLRSGNRFEGVFHCEAFIACLLLLLVHPELVNNFEEQLHMLPGEEEIKQMKALMDELRASNVFMHHLNIADFNNRIAVRGSLLDPTLRLPVNT